MKNVIVTGGAGYIGSHTCKALAQAGFCPITYDNLSNGHASFVKWGPFEQGDLRDKEKLEAVFKKYEPIAVLHFAAASLVGESVTDPAKYYTNNVVGTLSLLEAMRLYKNIPFIFSSTCATYGNPTYTPLDEEHPKAPITPYGHSKLMIEQIVKDFHKAYGLPYAFLRYFNACGADLDLEIGEEHNPETHLIPLILMAASKKRESINIFGTDYETPDGTAIRDYIHVMDLSIAHVKALQKLLDGKPFLEINLGTGKGSSVKEVIAAVEKISGKKVNVRLAGRREGDPPILVADAKKSFNELGWIPQYSDLNTIISSAWNWHIK